MSGKLPTEYNGLLRLLKEEQKHIQRLQEQIKKTKEDSNSVRNLLSEKEKKTEADAALVKNISNEMFGIKSNYSSLEFKMEQMTKKWIQNTRLLNQYSSSTEAADTEPPTGVVTWCFTDVQDSTPLWEVSPQLMQSALNYHNKIMREKILEHKGVLYNTSINLNPRNYHLGCEITDVQIKLHEAQWEEGLLKMHKSTSLVKDDKGRIVFNGLRVRMGFHTGVPDFYQRDATSKRMDYFGPAMNLAARVGGVGTGGQVVFSATSWKDLQKHVDFLSGVQVKELGTFALKGVEQQQQLFEMLPHSLAYREFVAIAPPQNSQETMKLASDLKKMKEENELILSEMSKMKDTVQAAQEKCASVQSLIKQFKKNNLDALNPATLLKEVEDLMTEQENMRKMVEITQTQTLKIQANLENVDDKVEKVREQQRRVFQVTMSQLPMLLNRIDEMIKERERQQISPVDTDKTFKLPPGVADDLVLLKQRIQSQMERGAYAGILSEENIEMAPSMLMGKEIELAKTCYDAAKYIDHCTNIIQKVQDTIKQKESQINEDTRQINELQLEVEQLTREVLRLQEASKYAESSTLPKPLSPMPFEEPAQLPPLPPPAMQHKLEKIPSQVPPKTLDTLTRMKIALKKLEKEYNLPTEFQHVEGNIFSFGMKKLKLFWAGENIGVRMGGGFLSIDQWLQQQTSFKDKQQNIVKKNARPPSLPKLSGVATPT